MIVKIWPLIMRTLETSDLQDDEAQRKIKHVTFCYSVQLCLYVFCYAAQ